MNMWPAAMEQAFVGLGQHYPDLKINANLKGGNELSAFKIMYDETRVNIRTLTIRENTTQHTTSNVDEDLWAVWNQVGTQPTTSDLIHQNTLGLPHGHAYSAINCDQKKGIVTLRNPWGIVSHGNLSQSVKTHEDGIFDISFEDWKRSFGYLTTVKLKGKP